MITRPQNIEAQIVRNFELVVAPYATDSVNFLRHIVNFDLFKLREIILKLPKCLLRRQSYLGLIIIEELLCAHLVILLEVGIVYFTLKMHRLMFPILSQSQII